MSEASSAQKALVRRFFDEALNGRRPEVIDELFDPDLKYHGGLLGFLPGREGLKQFVTMFLVACPDLLVTIDDVIVEGTKVVTRWTLEGTAEEDIMGIAPGGKRISMDGIVIDRVEGGRIVERWVGRNDLALLQQLGQAPEHPVLRS